MEDYLNLLFSEYRSIVYEIVSKQFHDEDFTIYGIDVKRYMPNGIYSNKHKFRNFLEDISVKLNLYESDSFGNNEYYNYLDNIEKKFLVIDAFKNKEHPVFACEKIFFLMEKNINISKKSNKIKDDKSIQEFFCQDGKVKGQVDILTNKIETLLIRFREINLLDLNENIKYRENFLENNSKNVLIGVYLHLEIIYELSKSFEIVYKCLKIIVDLFPISEDVKYDKIDVNKYKKYVFPLNFVNLIKDNFYSKLNKKMENKIIFEEERFKREIEIEIRELKKGNVNKKIGNEINYEKFIDGVFEIILNDYIISNDKAVSASSTYRNKRIK